MFRSPSKIRRRFLPEKFNENACFRVERFGTVKRVVLRAVTFFGTRIVFFRSGLFSNAAPVSLNLVIYNCRPLANGTESWVKMG